MRNDEFLSLLQSNRGEACLLLASKLVEKWSSFCGTDEIVRGLANWMFGKLDLGDDDLLLELAGNCSLVDEEEDATEEDQADVAPAWPENLDLRQKAILDQLRKACESLVQAGIVLVKVEYEGALGVGTLKSVTAYDAADKPVPFPSKEIEGIIRDSTELFLPNDWKDEEGSFGTLYLITTSRKAELSHACRREGGWSQDFDLG